MGDPVRQTTPRGEVFGGEGLQHEHFPCLRLVIRPGDGHAAWEAFRPKINRDLEKI